MSGMTFGGPWTEKKLRILGDYLDGYTTALKNLRFRLIYVDAFAGEGSWRPSVDSPYRSTDYDDFRGLHRGSPRIALEVTDRPFDRFVFMEKDPERSNMLKALRSKFPDRDITICNEDANAALPRFCDALGPYDRAVVFLDPFATEVSWRTVERLADTEKVDCWILFPVGAIARMMPRGREPLPELALQLNRVFGGREYWQELYDPRPQLSLFGETGQERTGGSRRIADCYRNRLEGVFAKVAPSGREFKNSRNSPMFQLFFASSNPSGATIAVRIATHLIDNW